MKYNKYSLILFLGLILSSCGDSLADLNVDPNTSPTARPQEVLTSGIGYYGIALEGYFNETDAVLAQYWAGGPGVAIIDLERYFIEPGDFNTEWSFSYLQALSDLDFVIDNGNDSRKGAAMVLSTAIYQNLVDHFGPVPYSQALKGAIEDGSVLTPTYDSGKEIYDDLLVKLDEAIDLLNSADEMGGEDLIFQGDNEKWIRFANSLKLRLLMRQAPNDASVSGQVVDLISNGSFITSADNMAVIPFIGDAGNWNPQYARREQGIGMFYVASNSFVDVLVERNDPRLSILFDPAVNTGAIEGLDQGGVADLVSPSKDDYSYPSEVSYSNDNDVILMSHWEVMFLRAEAAMRFGTADDEKSMFDNAVTAHFDYVGASGATEYLSDNANYDPSQSMEIKSGLIGVQKWISMCGLQESEGWIEARRFDTSNSPIFTGSGGIFNVPPRSVLGTSFPSIRLYPQSELSFNPNTPAGRSLSDKVFWDN